MEAGLVGLRVVAFEGRRAVEMAELLRRHGGEPLSAPVMREVPVVEDGTLGAYVRDLEAGAVDVVVLLTGVGLRKLADTVAKEFPTERLAAALRRAVLVARGPKPVAVLREMGLSPDVTAPEPNTWRELLAAMDAHGSLAGRTVAVQEYGVSNPAFLEELAKRGARVRRVEIYRWALPEDTGPLRAALAALGRGEAHCTLFTSANQVWALVRFAEEQGFGAEALRRALRATVVASVGPMCSEALRENGIEPVFEPSRPKMGVLVGELARAAPALLARCRSGELSRAATSASEEGKP